MRRMFLDDISREVEHEETTLQTTASKLNGDVCGGTPIGVPRPCGHHDPENTHNVTAPESDVNRFDTHYFRTERIPREFGRPIPSSRTAS